MNENDGGFGTQKSASELGSRSWHKNEWASNIEKRGSDSEQAWHWGGDCSTVVFFKLNTESRSLNLKRERDRNEHALENTLIHELSSHFL